ncbi:MAG: hypothetical protein ACRD6R_06055 [Candidatus Polarisedimenticolia bacterium]
MTRRALPVAALLAAVLPAGGCGAPPADPVRERLAQIADPRAAEVVAMMFAAYGGHPAWTGHRSASYIQRLEFYGGEKTPRKISRQSHRFSLDPPVRLHLEDLEGETPQVVREDGDLLEVLRGGVPVTDPGLLEFPRFFGRLARDAFMQPWNLLAPGADLAIRSARTPPAAGRVPAGPCDVVRLSHENPDGTPGSDWSDFYVSRLSHLVDRVHTFRAEDGAYRVTLWSDHRMVEDVRIATRRATYSSDVTGAIGPLEVVVEYAGLGFDGPVFDGTPLAATPTAR